jgi:hypothetical protein
MDRAKWFITAADSNPGVFQLDSLKVESWIKPKVLQPSLFELATGQI